MAGEEGTLKVLQAWRYRVFGGPGFAGNPTALHLVEPGAGAAAMLAHSRTLPSSDNAYYHPTSDPGAFRVRVFSGHGELLVCGHALLATAQHLARRTELPALRLDTERFSHAVRVDERGVRIALPAWPGQELDMPLLRRMLEESGVRVSALLHFPWEVWVAVTDSPAAVAAFAPGEFAWDRLEGLRPGALILTAALADSYAYRYFAPWFGKPEDPATGSAHCYLARYWLRGGAEVDTVQASPAGEARMRVTLDADRVWLGGTVQRD